MESRGVFPHPATYIPPTAIKTTKGWVRADQILVVYRDEQYVKIRCKGLFMYDPCVVAEEETLKLSIDDQVDLLAKILWGGVIR